MIRGHYNRNMSRKYQRTIQEFFFHFFSFSVFFNVFFLLLKNYALQTGHLRSSLQSALEVTQHLRGESFRSGVRGRAVRQGCCCDSVLRSHRIPAGRSLGQTLARLLLLLFGRLFAYAGAQQSHRVWVGDLHVSAIQGSVQRQA